MFEELALDLTELSEGAQKAINYGFVVLGGMIGGYTQVSNGEIRRAHYFALSGLIFFSVNVFYLFYSQFLVSSLAGGFFWFVLILELFSGMVAGFFVGRIAADRSRDAYGDGFAAPLAFIPIANLWLLFKPSKQEVSANRVPAIPAFSGGFGVLFGFFMMVAGAVLGGYVAVESERRVEEAASKGVFDKVMLVRNLVTMAAEVPTPLEIDEATTLVRLEAKGKELLYVYEVDVDFAFLTADFRSGLVRQNCSYEAMSGVIDAGATLKHIYSDRGGNQIGVVEVNRQMCGR